MVHNGHHGNQPRDGDVIILGAGWVGSRLAAHLLRSGQAVQVTNRPDLNNRRKDPYFQPVPLPEDVTRHEFDLTNHETWSSLPPPSTLRAAVITFSVSPDHGQAFWEEYLRHVPRVVCYSSTAVYKVEQPGQLVDEGTPLRSTPRALAERYMQERGATVLTISGIFGEPRGARGVCTCLNSYASAGNSLNAAKSVNMVHVEDIIQATTSVLTLPPTSERGVRINVGGHHFLLRDLMEHCQCSIDASVEDPDDPGSKRVCSTYLLRKVLPPGYSFAEPLSRDVPCAPSS